MDGSSKRGYLTKKKKLTNRGIMQGEQEKKPSKSLKKRSSTNPNNYYAMSLCPNRVAHWQDIPSFSLKPFLFLIILCKAECNTRKKAFQSFIQHNNSFKQQITESRSLSFSTNIPKKLSDPSSYQHP